MRGALTVVDFFRFEEEDAMFEICVKQADAALRGQEEVDALVYGIDRRIYSGLLRSMLSAGFEAGGVPVDRAQLQAVMRGPSFLRGRPADLVGEIFFTDHEVYVLQPTELKLLVWSVRYHTMPSHLEEFCEVVKETAARTLDGRRLRGMDFTFSELLLPPPRGRSRRGAYRVEELKSKDPEYSETQASQALLLSSADHRAFLLALAQARGRARSVDTTGEVGPEIVTPLLAADLIGREYLVICRKDSHTICTVRDKSQLESSVEMHCTVCARPFREELIQEIFVISGACISLLNNSQWMTIWITDILKKAGIGFDKVKWSTAAGEDEIDVIVDVNGRKIFLELKDREFGVGDAYPFLYRVQRFGGFLGIVACTSRIGDEVKKIFGEPGIRIETIEGVDAIQGNLPRLVDEFSQEVVVSLIEPLTEDLGINLGPILQAWMAETAAKGALELSPGN